MSNFKEVAESKYKIYSANSEVSSLEVTGSAAVFYSKDGLGNIRKHEFTAAGASIVTTDLKEFPQKKKSVAEPKVEVKEVVEETVTEEKQESVVTKALKKIKGK